MSKTLSAIGILLASAPLSCSLHAENIKLVIQEFAPYAHTNPQTHNIEGYFTDKVREIFKRSGDTSSAISTSLARGLQMARTDENTCILSLRRTPERENMFRWVGPITTTNWVLYGKNNNPHKLKNIQDARAFRIGSYKNSATGLELTAQGYKVELAASDEENPNLIIMNRIDYWIVAEQRGKYIAEQKGYGKDISPVITYKTIDLYMLCHPGMDNARIEKYNQLSKDIDKDGTMEKILRKYGVR